MPPRTFHASIAAHRGLLVFRCKACGHAWVAEWTPLTGGCPECHEYPETMFKAGARVWRRFPRKVATELAALLRDRKVDEAWAAVRTREAGGERFVEGRGR
jgi:hypothetical protein